MPTPSAGVGFASLDEEHLYVLRVSAIHLSPQSKMDSGDNNYQNYSPGEIVS
jgi:hypothetical protein